MLNTLYISFQSVPDCSWISLNRGGVGKEAVVPVGGVGRELMRKAATLKNRKTEIVGPDILISGTVVY